MDSMQKQVFTAEVKEYDEKDLTVEHFISTEAKDRGGDIMRADGMKIKGKVVVLMAHGKGPMGVEPIAKPVWIKPGDFKNRKGIMAKTQFFPDELGQRLWRKTVDGYMPNWSVGYLIHRAEDIDNYRGRDVKEWELLEYSPVGVPMNPDAQTIKDGADAEILFKIMPDDKSVDMKDLEDAEEKPYPNEHACRLEDPGKYDRIRRQNDKFGAGIHALWGIKGDNPVELQAIRLDLSKFTADEAKAWLKDHDYACKLFEPATGKEEGESEEKEQDVDNPVIKAVEKHVAEKYKDADIPQEVTKQIELLQAMKAFGGTDEVITVVAEKLFPEIVEEKQEEKKEEKPDRFELIETAIKDVQTSIQTLTEKVEAIKIAPADEPGSEDKGDEDGKVDNPPDEKPIPRLVFSENVDTEEKARRDKVVSIAREVLKTEFQKRIDKMRGKVT